jgi:hypothetical protein
VSNVSEERLCVEFSRITGMCRMLLKNGYVSNPSEERLCIEFRMHLKNIHVSNISEKQLSVEFGTAKGNKVSTADLRTD